MLQALHAADISCVQNKAGSLRLQVLFSPRQTMVAEEHRKRMLAGKRCSPALIYLFIAIIVGALAFVAVSHGPDRQPKTAPIHEKQ